MKSFTGFRLSLFSFWTVIPFILTGMTQES